MSIAIISIGILAQACCDHVINYYIIITSSYSPEMFFQSLAVQQLHHILLLLDLSVDVQDSVSLYAM